MSERISYAATSQLDEEALRLGYIMLSRVEDPSGVMALYLARLYDIARVVPEGQDRWALLDRAAKRAEDEFGVPPEYIDGAR